MSANNEDALALPVGARYPAYADLNAEDFNIEEYYPGCDGCNGSGFDYCRCREYDLSAMRISVVHTLARMFACPVTDFSSEVIDWAAAQGFAEEAAYFIDVARDYYGEEITICLHNEYLAKLQKFFREHEAKAS